MIRLIVTFRFVQEKMTPSWNEEAPMSQNETRPTMSVPAAGWKFYGIGKNAAYQAARRGQIPTIRIGGRILAVVAAIERQLASIAAQEMSNADPSAAPEAAFEEARRRAVRPP
jgi:hypothetical protein